ncbi:MAG TPA: hybrid sensor histidine kinase/response regulator [Methanospirillum sp.]|nr:hybrid sensor histidine kinase/response regulator [Methanospirillum sp.]
METQRRYILIAEDSRTQAEMLRCILMDQGYETEIAESGTAALASISVRMPDLLLTDIVMPGMDGYDLCMAIRSNQSIAELPIILVTHLYDPDDVLRALSCGANNFIIKPYTPTELISRIDAVLKSRDTSDDQDGIVWIEYNGTRYPVRSDKDALVNILLSIYDAAVSKNVELEQTTERLNVLTCSLEDLVKERTSALQKTTDTVKHLLMQKNDLITKIGHDLKTPLTPLVALLPHVREHEQNSEMKEILDVLVHDAQMLKGLVDQILRLSHLNQESFSMIESDIPVKKVIDDVINGYSFSINQLGLTVQNHVSPACSAHISPFHATIIFENLISNAIKYNIKNGMIILNACKDDGYLIFSVEDTGIGLTKEEADQVFDEFYKADPSRHDTSSHGLGLPIVQRIIFMYGGSVQVISPGRGMGSIFQIRLPTNNRVGFE